MVMHTSRAHRNDPRRRRRTAGSAPTFGSFADVGSRAARPVAEVARPAAGRTMVPESLRKFGFRRLGEKPVRPVPGVRSGSRDLQAPGAAGVLAELVPPVVSAPVVARRVATAEPTGRSSSSTGPAHEGRRAPTGRAGRRRVRLTSRGHTMVMVLIAAMIAGASALMNAQGAAHADKAPAVVSQEVVVRPGETLTSIASRVGPADEHAALVALIRAANGLSGAADAPLPAGEHLIVPTP